MQPFNYGRNAMSKNISDAATSKLLPSEEKALIGNALDHFLKSPIGQAYYGGWGSACLFINPSSRTVTIGDDIVLRYIRYGEYDNKNQLSDQCYIFIQVYGEEYDTCSGHSRQDEWSEIANIKTANKFSGHAFAIDSPHVPEGYNQFYFYNPVEKDYIAYYDAK